MICLFHSSALNESIQILNDVTIMRWSMKNQGNAKAEYSKKLIADALRQCLLESRFEELTISEICAHAQVSRKTFYRNFANKREVLEFQNETIIQEYLTGLKNLERMTLSEVIL